MRDILWLRLLTVFAALLTMPYFILQTKVLYSALFWQFAFLAINVVHIILLIQQNRPVAFSEREARLKNLVFPNFNNLQLKKLFALGEWHTAQEGTRLVKQSSALQDIYLLEQGSVTVWQGQDCIARRLPGTFMGELGYLTGQPASADIVFSEDSHYLAWNVEELRALLKNNDQLSRGFESLLSIDVARKLNQNGKH